MSSHICSPKAITHLGRNLLQIFHLVYTPIGKSLFFHNLNCSCTIQELVIFCAYKSSNSCKKGTLQVSLPTLEVRLCRQTANQQRLNQKILGCILDTLQTLAAHIWVWELNALSSFIVDAAAIAKEFGNLHQIQYMHLSSFFPVCRCPRNKHNSKHENCLV